MGSGVGVWSGRRVGSSSVVVPSGTPVVVVVPSGPVDDVMGSGVAAVVPLGPILGVVEVVAFSSGRVGVDGDVTGTGIGGRGRGIGKGLPGGAQPMRNGAFGESCTRTRTYTVFIQHEDKVLGIASINFGQNKNVPVTVLPHSEMDTCFVRICKNIFTQQYFQRNVVRNLLKPTGMERT